MARLAGREAAVMAVTKKVNAATFILVVALYLKDVENEVLY